MPCEERGTERQWQVPQLGRGPVGHHSVPKSGLSGSFLHFPQMLPSYVKSLLRESPPRLLSLPLPLALKGTCLYSLGSPLHAFLPSPSSRPPFFTSVVLGLSAPESPGGPDQYRSLGLPTPRDCDPVGLGWSPRICISNKFSGDTAAACLGNTL